MIELTRETDAAVDFELGAPRATTLAYDVTWPQEGEAPGLVLVIAGFGDDTGSDYSRSLRRHIVETTGMAAVSVRYHAFHARPTNGGALRMDPKEQLYLFGLAVAQGVPVTNAADVRSVAQGLAAAKAEPDAWVWVDPPHGESQNFGVLQALDHLAVIGDLIENAPPFDTSRIVALGSSHGGYIAHLIAKIAPNTLAAIIDNSSYAQPPMGFLGIGDEAEVLLNYAGVRMKARTRSAWSVTRRDAPNFYTRDADLIRDLRYPPHVAAMRAAAVDEGVQYFMLNATHDTVSPPQAKQRQQAALSNAGFRSELALVGPGDIDGRLFKSFTHGLDASLRSLFDRYAPRIAPRTTTPDAIAGSVIAYDCVDRGYRFRHSAAAPYVTGEIYELYGDEAAPAASAAA